MCTPFSITCQPLESPHSQTGSLAVRDAQSKSELLQNKINMIRPLHGQCNLNHTPTNVLVENSVILEESSQCNTEDHSQVLVTSFDGSSSPSADN